MASLCALRLRASSGLQLLQPGPRSRVAPAPTPTPHHRRTAAPRPPVGCSSNSAQQASGTSSQPPERLQQQQAQQQQQTTAGSSSARVATGSGLVELRFVSSSPAIESEASSAQPQTGGKALFADRALLWHASPSFARCIDEAMGNDSGGASKQIVIPMPASEEAAVSWEPVLRLLRQEDLLPVTWANLPDLLRVAHTYDMAAVRSACVVFISLHVSQVSLRDAPLESAQNVLHLASLANRYLHMNIIILPTGNTGSGSGGGGGSGVSSSKGGASAAFRVSGTQACAAAADSHRAGLEPQLLPLVACIPAVMHNALAQLRYEHDQPSQSYHYARSVVDRLREISGHPKYKEIVTEPVRDALLAALLAGFACETPFIISQ
ncbi:hypothetical protein CHLRE_11g467776v5 [Chlamydomonas reinhardtii]|uniref:BTB domain-containing protein n=1 Tax=Chlamydomonas reinhardtii TaxID=3055 RepID=A0A2K3D813_CHLRE|nr:uncharacterized protein CHLRE_11g467776v5 [Chlamydomonas reinhardtii]PNW76656.1 hypothetical protein CHLRE_11g467776v5 [Chlamydomonas reinhardtii]